MVWTLQLIIFAETPKLQNAERVFRQIQNALSIELNLQSIEPYHKGGNRIAATYTVSEEKWSEAVFNALNILSLFSHRWELSADVLESLDAVSCHSKFSGITLITADMIKE